MFNAILVRLLLSKNKINNNMAQKSDYFRDPM